MTPHTRTGTRFLVLNIGILEILVLAVAVAIPILAIVGLITIIKAIINGYKGKSQPQDPAGHNDTDHRDSSSS